MAISVIMAAYNAENTIVSAVGSVINQSYENWELIVVDDCSTDATVEILETFAGDERIKIVRFEENRGVSQARKAGLLHSNNDWIAIIDSDDEWVPNKLEKQVALQVEQGGQLLYTGSSFMTYDGKPINWIMHVPKQLRYKEILNSNPISNSSVLVQSELYKRYYVERDDIHEDYAMWLSILQSGTTAYGVDEPLIKYRLSKSSKSSNKVVSAVMNWRTYRYAGIGRLPAAFHMVSYSIHGIVKYLHIKQAR